jgi:2'-5' RNA ligase
VRGRIDRHSPLQPEIARLAELELGWIDVDQCVTYASELTPTGPVYTPLSRAPLAGQRA